MRYREHKENGYMPIQRLTNEIIIAAIEGFEAQKKRIDAQIAELRSFLTGGHEETTAAPGATGKRGRFSDAARLRMKEAQQRRWAKIKGEIETPAQAVVAAKPKRQMSEAGRQAIADATRRRWAAKRAATEAPVSATPKKATRKKAAAKNAASKKASATVPTV
jgi:hypothetical protein